MEEREFATVLSVLLIVSLFFNGYFFVAMNHAKSQVTDLNFKASQNNLNINSKADDFDANFHDLLQEHTFLLINTVRRSLDSSTSFNASYSALKINVQETTAQIGEVYSTEVEKNFTKLLNTKIDTFIAYTNWVKNNNSEANANFESAMADYEESSASFWADLNPNIDKATIKKSITEHVHNVKSAIDFWAAKDYDNYFLKLHDSYTQIGDYADIIVTGIIKQHSELFS